MYHQLGKDDTALRATIVEILKNKDKIKTVSDFAFDSVDEDESTQLD